MFCTADLLNLIDYQQAEDPWGSDHIPVEFYIGINVNRYIRKTHWISNKKTKWDQYREELINKEEDLEKEEYLGLNEEQKYQRICEMMKEAVLKATYGEQWKKKITIDKERIKKNTRNVNKGYTNNPP